MAFEFQDYTNNIKKDEALNSIGKMIASGIGVGLSEDSYLAITALENVYVELETLSKNAAKNAEKLAKKRQQRELENLKTAKELEIITEKEYFEKLKKYRDENLKKGTDDWYKYTEAIAAYNKKLLEEEEKNQREMAEKILALREELSEKLKRDDPWLKKSKVTFKGMGQNGTDLIYNSTEFENFEEEIKLLENFRDRIIELKKLGNVPEGIFSDIARMDIKEGLEAASYILSADAETRKKFFSGYSSRDSLAQSAAGILNPILNAEALKENGIYPKGALVAGFVGTENTEDGVFIQTLKESFKEIPESYYSLGCESGDAFGRGFMERIPQLMAEARELILAEMDTVAQKISAAIKSAINIGAGVSNTYTNTYNFNSSRDTTTQQLSAAQSAATLTRLRGGEN